MEININDTTKTIEIWLSNAEQDNPVVLNSLPSIYQRYEKYTAAVFQSGQGDLFKVARDLLLHNRMLKTQSKGAASP